MHMLWRRAQVVDRADRLALTGAIVGRQLGSSNELTSIEALDVTDYLERLDRAGELADRAAAWLAAHRPAEPDPPDEPEVLDAGDGALALFAVDAPPVEVAQVETLSADRRRTQRQREVIAQGVHPLSLAITPTLRLHPDAPRDRDGDGPRCGDCRFRELDRYHNRTYPKCTAGAHPVTRRKFDGTEYQATEYPRVSAGAGTDVRAWWPACPDYQPETATPNEEREAALCPSNPTR
jgi:hypothetical protein